MGTTLTGKNISASYLGLLKTTDNAVIGSTAKRLTDGNGTDSPLFLSTSKLGIGVTPTEVLTIQSGNIQLSNDNKLQFGTSDVFIKGTTATDNIQIGLQGATKLTLHQTNGLTLAQYGSGSITGTVTQRLGVTSSGQVVEIPIGSGAVDGSGTANTVTMWSDSDTITDAPITISGNNSTFAGNVITSGNILINEDRIIARNTSDGSDSGTISLTGGGDASSSRGAYLQVFGNEHSSLAGQVRLVAGNVANAELRINAVSATGFITNYVGGSERMRLDSSGRLAIGSTSADAKLDISQSSATEPVLRLTDDGVANYDYIFPDSSTIKLETNTSSDKTFKLLNAGSGNFNFEVGGNIKLSDGGARSIIGPTNQTLIINSKPNSATEGTILQINGVDKLSILQDGNATFAGAVKLSSTLPLLYLTNTTSGTGKNWRLSSATNGKFFISEEGVVDGLTLEHTTGNATFAGSITGTSASLTTSGTVLSLDRTGGATALIELKVGGTVEGYLGATTTKSLVVFNESASEKFSVSNAGDGTFAGNVNITSSSKNLVLANSNNIRFENNAGAERNILTLDTDDDVQFGGSIDNIRFLTDDSSERMRITSAGNVGIGDTSPSAKLDVNAGASDTIAVFESTDNRGRIQISDDDTNVFVIAEGTKMSLGTSNTLSSSNLTIDSSGNVGIATTSPSKKFHVNGGSSDVSARIDTTNANCNFTLTTLGQQDWGIGVDYSDSGKLKFDASTVVGASTKLTIQNDGNVGIGTDSPTNSLLHLYKDGDTVLRLTAGNSSISSIQFGDIADQTRGRIFYNSSDDMVFATNNNAERMRIDSSGNLGLGTTSPKHYSGTSGTILSLHSSTHRGVLELSGASNSDDAIIGAITFANTENTSANGALSQIFTYTETTDSNAGDDSGGHLVFLTKPEAGTITESLRIESSGNMLMKTTNRIQFYNSDNYIGGISTNDIDIVAGDDINYKSNFSRFFSGSTEHCRLSGLNDQNNWIANGTGGKLGVGTTAPTATLQVNGDIKIGSGAGSGSDSDNMSIQVSNATYGDTANLGILVRNNGTNGEFAQIGFGYSESRCPVVIGSVITSGASATKGDFIIGTRSTTTGSDAPSERFRITSDGEVCVGGAGRNNGYNSSFRTLVVESVNTDSASIIELVGNRGVGGNQNGMIHFINTNSSAVETARISGINGASSVNEGALTFMTRTASTSLAEKVRIDGNGNLGIATSSPAEKLHVNGGFHVSSTANLTSGSTGLFMDYRSNESRLYSVAWGSAYKGMQFDALEFKFNTGSGSVSERMHISSGGTVSIPSGDRDNGGKGGALIVGGNVDSTGTTTNTRKIGIISSPSFDNTDGNVIMMANDSFDGTNHNLYLGSIYTGYTSPKNIVFITADAVGGSGSEAMRIMGDGDIGIGTTSPSASLEVSKGSEGDYLIVGGDNASNSRALKFTSSTATSNGALHTIDAQSSNGVIALATGGSERLRISSGGDIHHNFISGLAGSTDYGLTIAKQSGYSQIYLRANSTDNRLIQRFYNEDSGTLQNVGNISISGSTTTYATSSDYRLKENVVKLNGALDRISQLKPSRFNFIADAETTFDGFLAHEVQEIVPEAIVGDKDAVDEEGNAMYQGIDQSKLVPLLVASIQELKAEIDKLKKNK